MAGKQKCCCPQDPVNINSTQDTVLAPLGWVNVNANGSVSASAGGASALRIGLGSYALTPPAGAVTVQLTVVEALGTRDSIEIHPVNFLGTVVHISEGDNSATANDLRDRPFMAVWYGESKSFLTSVSVSP